MGAYPRELEADLRQKYGVRLSDRHRGTLTMRELLVYVHGVLQDRHSLTRMTHDERDLWDIHAESLNCIFQAITGRHLPHRPKYDADEVLDNNPEQRAAIAAAQAREAKRQEAIADSTQ